VELEGYVFFVVQALRKEEKDLCRYGQLIDDTRVMLNSLQTWKVNHVRNEVNVVAHRLAKKMFFLDTNKSI
jgi:hypothetical protein